MKSDISERYYPKFEYASSVYLTACGYSHKIITINIAKIVDLSLDPALISFQIGPCIFITWFSMYNTFNYLLAVSLRFVVSVKRGRINKSIRTKKNQASYWFRYSIHCDGSPFPKTVYLPTPLKVTKLFRLTSRCGLWMRTVFFFFFFPYNNLYFLSHLNRHPFKCLQ